MNELGDLYVKFLSIKDFSYVDNVDFTLHKLSVLMLNIRYV